jgi:hypothetical protein
LIGALITQRGYVDRPAQPYASRRSDSGQTADDYEDRQEVEDEQRDRARAGCQHVRRRPAQADADGDGAGLPGWRAGYRGIPGIWRRSPGDGGVGVGLRPIERWGIEGACGLGRHTAMYLVGQRHDVRDVCPTRTAEQSRRRRQGTTDALDSLRIAREIQADVNLPVAVRRAPVTPARTRRPS